MDEKYNYKNLKTNRGSGILLHISSLPSPYGIGSLGEEAYRFVNFLKEAGQKFWQILPLGPTGYGDSPYQSFSAYAGNPYFIDLDFLVKEELLTQEEIETADFGTDPTRVDYEKLYRGRSRLLEKAYIRFKEKDQEKFLAFQKRNAIWLEDYCLYMLIKEKQKHRSWAYWPEEFRRREGKTLGKWRLKYAKRMEFFAFVQYKFYQQWQDLKNYANEQGISFIGDIPIYVAQDSADAWANPEIFQFDQELNPEFGGGCPPDDFSNDGQLWGNPVYNWEVLEKEGYTWWIRRINWNFKLFDVLRIDHFRGFESFWKVPYGDATAAGGHWEKGPAMKLFQAVKKELGDLPIIAEDLGYMTREVYEFREATRFPGMKILQFAFSPSADSDYLPHNYTDNCVVYTGTHDNDTIAGWKMNAPAEEIYFATRYMGIREEEGLNWGLIRGALRSVAKLAVFQMQDLLGLDNDARMNNPGTLGGNWCWRMKEGDASEEIAQKLRELCRIYGR